MTFLYLDEIKTFARASVVCSQKPKHPVRTDEVDALASRLTNSCPMYAVKTAVAWHLCYTLLAHYGVANRMDLEPVVEILRSALHGWSGARGVSPDEVQVALNRLQQAGETAHYLSTIPD